MSRELERVSTPDGDVVRVVDDGRVVAEVRQRGAQVTRWRPDGGDDVVFAGARHQEPADRVAHGGVPVCFPWFANGPRGDRRPSHGPARSVLWREVGTGLQDDVMVSSWSLDPDGVAGADGAEGWPPGVRVRLTAELGPRQARLVLAVENASDAEVMVEAALHTYLRVGEVSAVHLRGLDGATYLDKVASAEQGAPVHRVQEGDLVLAGEVDRVHDSTWAVVVADPVLGREIEVAKEGSGTTVVWNPWQEKGSAFADLTGSEWRELVCVEAAAAGEHALVLAAGASHELVQRITVR